MYTGGCCASIVRICDGDVSVRRTVSSSRKNEASPRARRVPRGEVEAVEVVMRGLDFAAVDDAVAEPEEDVLDLAPDLRDQVEPSASTAGHGKRDVDALLGEAPVELGALQLRLSRIDGSLDPLASRVERHPGLALAHLAERQLELALPPEVLDARPPRSRPSTTRRLPPRGPLARAPRHPSGSEGIKRVPG